ncbi:hypothetical protein SUGI_0504750 [Cryptomeria japonica]|uniref:uncharacterized protein LOC131035599 n=1 Tax=Cryptomeria japonica TaxID=3369 RepID=UPI002408D525|nr:uncharacterized protein LOC131035599 [Cryptomeria japonica]GLJ26264.1 hypothetical protein SUGI_0504750 [Cryptomeria japonica]
MNDREEDSDYLRLTLSPPRQSSCYTRYSSDSAPTSASAPVLETPWPNSTTTRLIAASSPLVETLWSGTTTTTPSITTGRGSTPAARPRRTAASGSATVGGAAPSRAKEERIVAPYPWATERRAVVHSLDYLLSQGILSIRGDLVCKRCDGKESRDVDLQSGFLGLSSFFLGSKDTMHDRAPKVWMVPRLLDCGLCHQSDCVKPVIDDKKRRINWLFLLLTQTLGLCTLDQLKYFCKHTKKHRTGAKDRVLYLTYVGLLKQLNPSGPYE